MAVRGPSRLETRVTGPGVSDREVPDEDCVQLGDATLYGVEAYVAKKRWGGGAKVRDKGQERLPAVWDVTLVRVRT